MEKKQIKIGAILSYISIIINNIVTLIYTPIMLRLIGQSEYGLYSLVSSVISYLTVLDLGFGNAIVVYTAKFRKNKDKTKQSSLNGMFIVIFTIIGIIAIVIGTVLYLNIGNLFGETMTSDELNKAKIMIIILIINLGITFPFSVFSSIITAYEKFIFSKTINIIRYIVTPCIIIPFLFLGYKSIAMVVINTIINILYLLVNMIYCIRKLKIGISFKHFDYTLLKEIFKYSFFIFIGIIVDKINWSVDKFILGTVSGTIAVAVYSVASNINSIYISFSSSVNGILLPKISRMIMDKAEKEKLSEIFIKIGRIQYLIIGLIISGFIVYGEKFITLWAGQEYKISYIIACILMIPATIPLIQGMGLNIIQAMNKHQFRNITYLIISIFNICISIPLAKIYGGVGTAIGTAVAMILGNGILMNWYYRKKIELNISDFWKNILKMSIPLVFLMIIGIIVNYSITTNTWLLLIVQILCYTILYCLLSYKFSMNQYEKGLVNSMVGKLIKRKNKNEGERL